MKHLTAAMCRVASVLLLTCASEANAFTREITAVFRPDSSKPNENTFLNTTPVSGYCAQYPSECRATKMFSIRLPFIFSSTSPIQANHGDARQGAMFKLPTTWRTTQVTHSVTGETEVVEVRWSGIGSTYRLSGDAIDLVGGGVSLLIAHQRLWRGLSWVYAPRLVDTAV